MDFLRAVSNRCEYVLGAGASRKNTCGELGCISQGASPPELGQSFSFLSFLRGSSCRVGCCCLRERVRGEAECHVGFFATAVSSSAADLIWCLSNPWAWCLSSSWQSDVTLTSLSQNSDQTLESERPVSKINTTMFNFIKWSFSSDGTACNLQAS